MEASTRAEGKRYWQLVADELRAEAARQRVTGVELGRRMGRAQQWVSRRMVGELPLDLDELESFAKALNVPLTQLLSRAHGDRQPAVLRRPERHLRLVQPAAPVPAQRHPLVTSH